MAATPRRRRRSPRPRRSRPPRRRRKQEARPPRRQPPAAPRAADRADKSVEAFREALERSFREVVDDAVKRGRMTRDDANELVGKLVTGAQADRGPAQGARERDRRGPQGSRVASHEGPQAGRDPCHEGPQGRRDRATKRPQGGRRGRRRAARPGGQAALTRRPAGLPDHRLRRAHRRPGQEPDQRPDQGRRPQGPHLREQATSRARASSTRSRSGSPHSDRRTTRSRPVAPSRPQAVTARAARARRSQAARRLPPRRRGGGRRGAGLRPERPQPLPRRRHLCPVGPEASDQIAAPQRRQHPAPQVAGRVVARIGTAQPARAAPAGTGRRGEPRREPPSPHGLRLAPQPSSIASSSISTAQ